MGRKLLQWATTLSLNFEVVARQQRLKVVLVEFFVAALGAINLNICGPPIASTNLLVFDQFVGFRVARDL